MVAIILLCLVKINSSLLEEYFFIIGNRFENNESDHAKHLARYATKIQGIKNV